MEPDAPPVPSTGSLQGSAKLPPSPLMSREPIPTWFFVLVVVRRGDHFLLVQERKHGQLWYLPAGRVEPGEDFTEAALRETMEEAGIRIVLDGILRIETNPSPEAMRIRIIFTARSADDTPPKSEPDSESLRAGWFTLAEIRSLPLRGTDVVDYCAHFAAEGVAAPMALLAREGMRAGVHA